VDKIESLNPRDLRKVHKRRYQSTIGREAYDRWWEESLGLGKKILTSGCFEKLVEWDIFLLDESLLGKNSA
jgi:hypothetical protein